MSGSPPAREIAALLSDRAVVVTKSTVPAGTGDEIERRPAQYLSHRRNEAGGFPLCRDRTGGWGVARRCYYRQPGEDCDGVRIRHRRPAAVAEGVNFQMAFPDAVQREAVHRLRHVQEASVGRE